MAPLTWYDQRKGRAGGWGHFVVDLMRHLSMRVELCWQVEMFMCEMRSS